MTPAVHTSRAIAGTLIAVCVIASSSFAQRNPFIPQGTIHAAASAGNLDLVKRLLQNPANLELVDPAYHNTPLLAALAANQTEVAMYLLDHGASVAVKNIENSTPLHLAAIHGQVDIIKRIKAMKGSPPGLSDNLGRLPLHHAIDRGHIEAARLLLPRRALLGQRDGNGNAPLDLALGRNDENMALFLLDAGAPVADEPAAAALRFDRCVQKDWAGALDRMLAQLAAQPELRQPLLDRAYALAFANGNNELVKRLSAAGANAGGSHSAPTESLFAAADANNESLVGRLLASGTNPNESDPRSGWTPLHAAAMFKQLGIVQLLLDKGANPNAADGLQRTPLHIAAIAGQPGVAARLLKAGADPARLDSLGNSPLHYAAQYGSGPIARKLVELHAPQRPNTAGLTPFDLAGDAHPELQSVLEPSVRAVAQGTPLIHAAIQTASLADLRQTLERAPAQLNQRDAAGYLLIHLAAEIRDTQILQELLARGAPVNDAQNAAKWTPLHFAAASGNAPGLRLLLEKGADLSALDALGRTPADVARLTGNATALAALK